VISTCMKLLPLGTPICQTLMAFRPSLLCLRTKSRTASPGSDGQRDFTILLYEPCPSILRLRDFFCSKTLSHSSLLLSLFPQYSRKELSFLSFFNSDSFRYFSHNSCTQPPTVLEVLRPSNPVHSPAIEIFHSLSSESPLRLQIKPTLFLHSSTNPIQLLGE
jgi:hypothetical protein